MRILITLTLVFLTFIGFSQSKNWCGTYYFDSIEIANDPTILDRRDELSKFTQTFVQQKDISEETLIIPVVFHVLHKYGDERISLDQCKKAIEIINEDYSAQNNDLSTIINEFKSIIGTTNVEFRLAQLDPDGNCTNGVVYYETNLTYNASNTLKYTIRNWDRESYLNVWTVASIESGAAAWSHYPGISGAMDGVVSIHSYVGSGHTLSHEIGHYLNLRHPWGDTNEPEVDSNCDMDDGVEDTPNTIGSFGTCNLSQVTCESLDNVQNIMDYGSCDAMFTAGQTTRMRAALNSLIGSRSNLWANTNLTKTGTQDGYIPRLCDPVSDFSSVRQMIYEGESVTFEGLVSNGTIDRWSWEFENGEPVVSNNQFPEITYNTPGLYQVALKASNDNGQDILTREKLVRVIDTLDGIVAPAYYDMQDEEFPAYTSNVQKQWLFESDKNVTWEAKQIEENNTLRILNQNISEGTSSIVISPNINLMGIDNPDYIYFDYAYAQRAATNADELKVFVSNNAGKNWNLRFTIRGKSMATNNNVLISDIFVPNENEWKTGKINMAYNKSDNYVMLKFETISKGGNALYIDNLQIGDPVSVYSNKLNNFNLKIYPNPANEVLNLAFKSNTQPTRVNIYNMLGRMVYNQKIQTDNYITELSIDLNKHNLEGGVYFVELLNDSQKSTRRFIIQ